MILCSPSNPTGSVYSKEELAGLAAVLAKYPQVVVIADEIYEHINYIGAHQSIAQFPEMKRTYSDRERCIQSLCDDWMENRFHCWSGMDCESL